MAEQILALAIACLVLRESLRLAKRRAELRRRRRVTLAGAFGCALRAPRAPQAIRRAPAAIAAAASANGAQAPAQAVAGGAP